MSWLKKEVAVLEKEAAQFFHWLGEQFHKLETQEIPVAIAVVKKLQELIKSGEVDFIVKIADALTKSNVPDEIVGIVKLALPKALAFLTALELPPNPTEEQLQAWSKDVIAAIGIKQGLKGQIETNVAVHVFLEVKAFKESGATFTFAEASKIIEDAYQYYKSQVG